MPEISNQPLPTPPLNPPADLVTVDCRLGSTAFRVFLPPGDLASEIAPRLQSLRASVSRPDVTFHVLDWDNSVYVFCNRDCIAIEENAAAARGILLQEIVRLSREDMHWLALLHAGACGTESKCVVFPAATHSGKSTLAAVLIHSGLALYSEDSVGLERDTLTIPAMPFPLVLREGSWPVVAERFPDFEHAPVYDRYGQNVKLLNPGDVDHRANAKAAAIVFSRWQSEAKTTIASISPFEALIRLKDTGFWIAPDRESIQTFLDWLQALPIYGLVYSDVDAATAFVRDLLLLDR